MKMVLATHETFSPALLHRPQPYACLPVPGHLQLMEKGFSRHLWSRVQCWAFFPQRNRRAEWISIGRHENHAVVTFLAGEGVGVVRIELFSLSGILPCSLFSAWHTALQQNVKKWCWFLQVDDLKSIKKLFIHAEIFLKLNLLQEQMVCDSHRNTEVLRKSKSPAV